MNLRVARSGDCESGVEAGDLLDWTEGSLLYLSVIIRLEALCYLTESFVYELHIMLHGGKVLYRLIHDVMSESKLSYSYL